MNERMRRFEARVQVRAACDRVPIADAMELRRKKLHAHNREVIPAAAEVIGAMVDAARNAGVKIAALRCEKSRRIRQLQFAAAKPMEPADILAIHRESTAGAVVALAGIRELARQCGYGLVPLEATPPADLGDAGLSLIETTANAGADLVRDARDNGQIDEPDTHISKLTAIGEAASKIVAGIRASVAPRVAAHLASRVSR